MQRPFWQPRPCWEVSPFLFSAGPGVAGYLTAGTGTTVMPSGPPPVDNDSGDQGWWTCSPLVLLRHPDCRVAVQLQLRQELSVSRRGRWREKTEDRRLSLSDTKPLKHLVQPPSSLPLQMTLKSLQKNKQKNFELVLTNLFCSFAYFLVSPSDIQKFTFCMNIFFTLNFFSWKRHLKTE